MSFEGRVNILLVDDRPENLLALEAVLEPLGQNLIKASSGEEALKRLLSDDFAVILLDVQMPGLDGFETAELIKAREKTRHIPIIFLTAISKDPHHALRGYSVGAVDYIFKPFDPEVLRSKVGVFIDLYNLKYKAELMAHRALHDGLTGLPNRALFRDRLEMALKRIRRRAGKVAVLFLDLDGFKLVNDGLGHDAGDQLLVQVAKRLTKVLRPSDTVARFAGDEFTILSEGILNDGDVGEIAERISAALTEPYVLGRDEISISASIGIAVADGPEDNPDELMRDADAAMYRAKEGGRSRHETFDGSVNARAAKRLELENALHRAWERREFVLQYQPTVKLETGRIVGVEALIRWCHPDRGMLAPAEFIPSAEQNGLIVPVGGWALEEACRQAADWKDAGPEAAALTIAVNLSAHQLAQPDLVDRLAEILAKTGADPSRLCLEITESVVMEDAESIITSLNDLKALGVSLAIDDFGTGYSSLSYLKRFPMDILKIDRSFVDGLGRDPQSSSIAEAIVSLSHVLGLTATAEGVETAAQLEDLRSLGCDFAQGFYFAPPLDPDDVLKMLHERSGGSSDGPLGNVLTPDFPKIREASEG
jgi:diguanylate cyclase (GGDEF)-like protein